MLMSLSNVALFFTTAVVMICTPGSDIIYVSTRGIAQGRGVALLSTFGICVGYIVHTALAVLGLSAILQASATAFEVVRYAGAAYLQTCTDCGFCALLGARKICNRFQNENCVLLC
jgi:threonine/homoserine/homoserine lactone efflux protein